MWWCLLPCPYWLYQERALGLSDMHVVTQGQQFSSQKWALIEVHISVVPDQTQSSQWRQIQNLTCCLQCKVSFSHFLDSNTVCGTENFADMSKIIVLGPKVGPNEHSHIAVTGLVVEECKCPPVSSKEIGFIVLLDGSGCIKAEQVLHEGSNYLAVPFKVRVLWTSLHGWWGTRPDTWRNHRGSSNGS